MSYNLRTPYGVLSGERVKPKNTTSDIKYDTMYLKLLAIATYTKIFYIVNTTKQQKLQKQAKGLAFTHSCIYNNIHKLKPKN